MLYTRKGDKGKTGTFGCDQKISKSSAITEALGCLDEANSYLGICKNKIKDNGIKDMIDKIQNDLFIIQAQVAGADKKIPGNEVKTVERTINNIEKKLPPIKTFLIPGANELSANFDFARTLARRAERRVVTVSEEKIAKIDPETLVYLNRLSSLLYAFARLSAQESGRIETPPTY
jgi:cob(I)alamin adenosyltransferase